MHMHISIYIYIYSYMTIHIYIIYIIYTKKKNTKHHQTSFPQRLLEFVMSEAPYFWGDFLLVISNDPRGCTMDQQPKKIVTDKP